MRKEFQPTEHQIQTEVMNYLGFKGWYAMRMNSGAIRSQDQYGKNRLIRLQPAGTPDVMAFKKTLVRVSPALMTMTEKIDLLFLEIKRPGNPPTDLQRMKMQELEQYGARCLVIHSIEELQKYGI